MNQVPLTKGGEVRNVPGLTSTVQVDSPVLHDWSADIDFTIPGNSDEQTSSSGVVPVVVRDGSPYGAGWGIDGINQLLPVADALNTVSGVLWLTGVGDYRFFADDGSGGYISPAEDFDTLTGNDSGGWTYTAKDQTKKYFNAAGLQSSVMDRDGVAIVYDYDGYGRLIEVDAPDGGVTTLSHDPSTGVLVSITEPGGCPRDCTPR